MSLRATRRRYRRPDPLASPRAVRSVLEQLRLAMPDVIPRSEKDLVSLLRAMRHIQRYPATDTKRGRPGRWKREDLLKAVARLSDILDRETSARTSLASFVDHYLRLLDFPADVVEALTSGDINLFEAEQLARITAKRLNATPSRARNMRVDALAAHSQIKASGARLRQRVDELLKQCESGIESDDAAVYDLEDFDPYDPTHLFWEQIKQLGFGFREIRREDVTDEEIEELLKASESVMALLSKIQRRKAASTKKIRI